MRGRATIIGITWVLVFFSVLGAGPAGAATVVRGGGDANAPLEIDPSGDPDVRLISAYQPSRVAWVARMPVTKRVEQVTVGDLARPSGCSSGYSFWLTEHTDGSWRQENRRVPALEGVALPATPGRVTFTIPPTTLHAGETYSVTIHSPMSGCETPELRTWEHDGELVNGGETRCELAEDYSTYNNPYRMWHVEGEADAVACPPEGSAPHGFDASMPTGWLQIGRGSNWDVGYVAGGNGWDQNPPCNSYQGHGVRAEEWRPHPTWPTTEYVCLYKNYASLEEPTDNGWYWGRPWWENRDGAVRDTYLRLDTIDYDVLLERHSPNLAYDSDEDFHALSPGAATSFFDQSDDPDDPGDSNQLEDQVGTFATANFGLAIENQLDGLHLGYLDSAYVGIGRRANSDSTGGDYISLRGDGSTGPGGIGFSSDGYDSDAAAMEALPGYANRVYGRVAHGGDGMLWLQYWIYYYYDSQRHPTGGEHEGDWEMIQVGLSEAGTPEMAAYSQHGTGERCGWSVGTKDGTHPVVYVARSSHASYARADHYDDPSPEDDADGGGDYLVPQLEQIRSNEPSWVSWRGRWGDSDSSPPGPQFQSGDKWIDPSVWAGGLLPCDAG